MILSMYSLNNASNYQTRQINATEKLLDSLTIDTAYS